MSPNSHKHQNHRVLLRHTHGTTVHSGREPGRTTSSLISSLPTPTSHQSPRPVESPSEHLDSVLFLTTTTKTAAFHVNGEEGFPFLFLSLSINSQYNWNNRFKLWMSLSA